jgi:hypothetical protein
MQLEVATNGKRPPRIAKQTDGKQPTNQIKNEGGDWREAQVDVPRSV